MSRLDPVSGARQWIERNPTAWRYMVAFALDRHRRGLHFGMKALVERVRWELAGVDSGTSPYKIDNRIVSGLARELVSAHPELKDSIAMRDCSIPKGVAA